MPKDFIDLRIDSEAKGDLNIKAFNISYTNEREEYEALLNNEDISIISETPPTVDKVGRILIIVKWRG